MSYRTCFGRLRCGGVVDEFDFVHASFRLSNTTTIASFLFRFLLTELADEWKSAKRTNWQITFWEYKSADSV
jgi:hypothetical protein